MGEPCVEWNREWIKSHPESHLAGYWETLYGRSKMFVNTSCETTAYAYLWKMGFDVNKFESAEFPSLREASNDAGPILVDVDEGDHYFVFHRGHVVESYFKQYGPRRVEFSEEFNSKYGNSDLVFYKLKA